MSREASSSDHQPADDPGAPGAVRRGAFGTRSEFLRAAPADVVEQAIAIRRATALDTTKGSFYWHFSSRDELVSAVLDTWVERHTDAIIRHVKAVDEPLERLHQLFGDVMITKAQSRVELSLLASVDDPTVAKAMRRITQRHVALLPSASASSTSTRRPRSTGRSSPAPPMSA